jgi:hypothetical protein
MHTKADTETVIAVETYTILNKLHKSEETNLDEQILPVFLQFPVLELILFNKHSVSCGFLVDDRYRCTVSRNKLSSCKLGIPQKVIDITNLDDIVLISGYREALSLSPGLIQMTFTATDQV